MPPTSIFLFKLSIYGIMPFVMADVVFFWILVQGGFDFFPPSPSPSRTLPCSNGLDFLIILCHPLRFFLFKLSIYGIMPFVMADVVFFWILEFI